MAKTRFVPALAAAAALAAVPLPATHVLGPEAPSTREKTASRLLERLGMMPTSRAALGLDISRIRASHDYDPSCSQATSTPPASRRASPVRSALVPDAGALKGRPKEHSVNCHAGLLSERRTGIRLSYPGRSKWAARLALSAGTGLLALVSALPAEGAVSVKTLVRSPSPIVDFAQDSGFIAWENGTLFDGFEFARLRVHIRRPRTGAQVNFSGPFSADTGAPAVGLALRRAVWADTPCGNICDQEIDTGALDDPVLTVVDEESWDSFPEHALTLAAGDGTDLVYGFLIRLVCDEDAQGNPLYATVGHVRRVVARSSTPIPGARGTDVLAVSSGHVLLQPRETALCGGPEQVFPVEVREVATGNLVTTFSPAGDVLAVGLDGATAAVLVRSASGGKRIGRYNADTGALLASTWVSRSTAPELDIASGGIVFRTGREIRLMDAATAQRDCSGRPPPFRSDSRSRAAGLPGL
jgi:hypothetical protein